MALPIGINLSHRWLIARLTYPPWNEKLHPLVGEVFGYGEWGIGHGEEITNAQCRQLLQRGEPPQRTASPMPQAAGRLSLSTHGSEFPAAFNEFPGTKAKFTKVNWG